MKKYAVLTSLALVLAIPSFAWSQNAPAPQQPPSSSGNPPAGGEWGNHNGGGQGWDENQFQERKAEALRRISQHLEEVLQRKRCVEAANEPQALRACMPQGGRGPGGNQNEGDRRGPPPNGGGQDNGQGGMQDNGGPGGEHP